MISPGGRWWILHQCRTGGAFLPYRGCRRVSTNPPVSPWGSQARALFRGESEVEHSRGNQEVRDTDLSLTQALRRGARPPAVTRSALHRSEVQVWVRLLPGRRPSLLRACSLDPRSFLLSLPPLVPLSLSQLLGESRAHHVPCCPSACPGQGTHRPGLRSGAAGSSGPSRVLRLWGHFAGPVPLPPSPAPRAPSVPSVRIRSSSQEAGPRWSGHTHPAHQCPQGRARPSRPCDRHCWPWSAPSRPPHPPFAHRMGVGRTLPTPHRDSPQMSPAPPHWVLCGPTLCAVPHRWSLRRPLGLRAVPGPGPRGEAGRHSSSTTHCCNHGPCHS